MTANNDDGATAADETKKVACLMMKAVQHPPVSDTLNSKQIARKIDFKRKFDYYCSVIVAGWVCRRVMIPGRHCRLTREIY